MIVVTSQQTVPLRLPKSKKRCLAWQTPALRRRKRAGAAMIEFAICLPIFFMITMATIETCRMIYLRQSLKIAAYECARLGIGIDATTELLMDQCDVIMLGRHLKSFEFSCSPADPATLAFGDAFTTTVRISAEENALVGSWFYRDKTVEESVTIMAEH